MTESRNRGDEDGSAHVEAPSHDPRTWLRPAPPKAEEPPVAPVPADSADEPSFDPSTWAGPRQTAFKPAPAGAEAPSPEPASDSFDPSTWAGARTTAFRPGVAAEARPAAARAVPSRTNPKLLVGAGAAGLVLLAGAGGAWWLTRGDAEESAAPAASASAPAPAPEAEIAPIPASAERSVLTLAGGSGLLDALTAQGLAPEQAQAAAAAATRALGPETGEIRLELALMRNGPQVSLAGLQIRRADGSGADVSPAGQGFTARAVAANMRSEIVVARGQMDAESFYSSAVAAGVNDALIPEFAAAFAYDFDFQREIKPGDVFEAAFEQKVNDRGQPVGAKRLLYASMTTSEKSKALYRFTPPGETEAGWFDGAGRSIRRSLMRTPVEGARISSQFGYRTHPILGYTKLHRGTDFAAPTGTPIYAAGDGVIEFAGPRGAAGNFISLRHDTGWRTTYMHLNAFAPVATTGARVTQGTEIGQVGTTGRSTGPHLHYEIWIDGQPVDSMTISVSEGVALSGEPLKAFAKERDRIDALRASSSL